MQRFESSTIPEMAEIVGAYVEIGGNCFVVVGGGWSGRIGEECSVGATEAFYTN